jgi:hypothetical protein
MNLIVEIVKLPLCMNMTVSTSETSVCLFQTARRNIAADCLLHTRHRENLKFHTGHVIFPSSLLSYFTERRGRVVNTPALYS